LLPFNQEPFVPVKQHAIGRACSVNGEKWNAYRILVGKRSILRPSWRWEDNIKIHLIAVGWGGMDWIHLV
jgi:hypothetical protein